MENENKWKIESKVTKAAVEFHNGECYIVGINDNDNENKGE